MRRSIPKSSRPLLAALACLLFLSACVDVKADLAVDAAGSARLKLHYAVSKMALSLDALRAESPLLPFPLSRTAFDEAMAAIPGSSLLSWAQAETSDDLVTDAELAFPNLAALASFLDPSGTKARYGESGGSKSLSLVLWPGLQGSAVLDPDVAHLVNAAFAPYSVNLSVTLPKAPTQAGIGTAGPETGRLRYTKALSELVAGGAPVVWEIRW